jgi:hypothetical protein
MAVTRAGHALQTEAGLRIPARAASSSARMISLALSEVSPRRACLLTLPSEMTFAVPLASAAEAMPAALSTSKSEMKWQSFGGYAAAGPVGVEPNSNTSWAARPHEFMPACLVHWRGPGRTSQYSARAGQQREIVSLTGFQGTEDQFED